MKQAMFFQGTRINMIIEVRLVCSWAALLLVSVLTTLLEQTVG
jgi:hypothetical protein